MAISASDDPEAIHRPSGEYASALTVFPCPSRAWASRPVSSVTI
jgi:hypothetical protein